MGNKLEKNKLNILDKLTWRIKFRELSSILGKNSKFAKTFMKNTLIQEQYNEHKDSILDLLRKAQTEAPEKLEDISQILIQTMQKAYERKYFDDKVQDENSNYINSKELIKCVINNINFSLDIRKLSSVAENVADQLTSEDYENKYLESEIVPVCLLSERIHSKYPLDVLRKIHFLGEEQLSACSYDCIEVAINAIRSGMEISEVASYIQIFNNKNIRPSFDSRNFLKDNMEFSSFFLAYADKYGYLPEYDNIEHSYSGTLDMNAAEKMSELYQFDYKKIRYAWFDYRIQKEMERSNLSGVRGCIEEKYFGMNYGDISEIIKGNKGNTFSTETQEIFELISKIEKLNGIDDFRKANTILQRKYENIDIGKSYKEVFDFYAQDKLNGVFNPKDFKGEKSEILYKGHKIPILKLKGEDYKGIIHAVGRRKPGSINVLTVEENPLMDNPALLRGLEGKSANISMSVEYDFAMDFFQIGEDTIYLGFSNLKPENVLQYTPGDGVTSTGLTNYNKRIENINTNIRDDNKGYDELLVGRFSQTEVPYELIDKDDRVLPDYILTFSGMANAPKINYENPYDKTTSRLLNYAIEYNIPIVEMDGQEYLKKYNKKYIEKLERIQSGELTINKDDFTELANFYRMCTFYSYGTPSIKNREDIFVECIEKTNLTEKNADAIRETIQEYDYCNYYNWEIEAIANLPSEKRDLVAKKMDCIREKLNIKSNKQDMR